MRGAEPPLRDRCVGIERALEGDLLQVRREYADHQEEVGVRGLGRDPEPGGDGPGDLRLRSEGRCQERDPIAEARVAHAPVPGGRLRAEARLARVQVEFRPARAAERPLALGPLHEALPRMAHLEEDRRLRRPPGGLALEEVAEEALLQTHPVVRVEVRPVLHAVHLEPLLG